MRTHTWRFVSSRVEYRGSHCPDWSDRGYGGQIGRTFLASTLFPLLPLNIWSPLPLPPEMIVAEEWAQYAKNEYDENTQTIWEAYQSVGALL